MTKYKVLSLFSGVAGLCENAIALAGLSDQFQVTQFVEINPYCQQVLRKRYPNIPIHDDIRTFNPKPRSFDGIVGGFPCQDISAAGKQVGIRGERSGLFFEAIRLIRVVRPRFVIMENVAALLTNGMGDVLSEFSAIGFNAEWSVVSAAEMGGVHKRERIFIIAYPRCQYGESSQYQANLEREKSVTFSSSDRILANT